MTHHPSFGTQLNFDPAGGTAYVAIGQVRDFSGPNISRGNIDVTDHDSANGYREFLPGLADGGEITFQLGWDPNSAKHMQGVGTGIVGDFESGDCLADISAWQIVIVHCAGTATWTFDGFMTGFSPSYPVEGQLVADCGVKVTGKPVLA
jgi:hypothetical protein